MPNKDKPRYSGQTLDELEERTDMSESKESKKVVLSSDHPLPNMTNLEKRALIFPIISPEMGVSPDVNGSCSMILSQSGKSETFTN